MKPVRGAVFLFIISICHNKDINYNKMEIIQNIIINVSHKMVIYQYYGLSLNMQEFGKFKLKFIRK